MKTLWVDCKIQSYVKSSSHLYNVDYQVFLFRPSKQVVLGQVQAELIRLRLKMCHLKQVVNWFDGITGQPIFFSHAKNI